MIDIYPRTLPEVLAAAGAQAARCTGPLFAIALIFQIANAILTLLDPIHSLSLYDSFEVGGPLGGGAAPNAITVVATLVAFAAMPVAVLALVRVGIDDDRGRMPSIAASLRAALRRTPSAFGVLAVYGGIGIFALAFCAAGIKLIATYDVVHIAIGLGCLLGGATLGVAARYCFLLGLVRLADGNSRVLESLRVGPTALHKEPRPRVLVLFAAVAILLVLYYGLQVPLAILFGTILHWRVGYALVTAAVLALIDGFTAVLALSYYQDIRARYWGPGAERPRIVVTESMLENVHRVS